MHRRVRRVKVEDHHRRRAGVGGDELLHQFRVTAQAVARAWAFSKRHSVGALASSASLPAAT